MSKLNYYIVHETEDPESEILCEGRFGTVAKNLDLNFDELKKAACSPNHLLRETHYVETLLYENWKNGLKTEKMDISEDDHNDSDNKWKNHIETVERMLDIYGNTIIYKNSQKVESALNEDGYYVKMTHEPKRVVRYFNTAKVDKYPECWIITLERKEKKESNE